MPQRKNSSLSNAKPNKPWVSKGGVSTPDTKDSGSKIYKVKNNPGELRNNKNNKNISGFQKGQPVKPGNSAKNSKKKSRKQKSKLKTRKQKTRKNKKLQNQLQKEAFAKKALFTKRKKKTHEDFTLHSETQKKPKPVPNKNEQHEETAITVEILPKKKKKKKKSDNRNTRSGKKDQSVGSNERIKTRSSRSGRLPKKKRKAQSAGRFKAKVEKKGAKKVKKFIHSKAYKKASRRVRAAYRAAYTGRLSLRSPQRSPQRAEESNSQHKDKDKALLNAIKKENQNDRKIALFMIKGSAKAVSTATYIATETTASQMSREARASTAPAISLLKASASSLRKPKQTHKHIAKEAKSLFKSQLSDDVSHAVSSVSTSGRIVKKPVTVPVKTVKTYRRVKKIIKSGRTKKVVRTARRVGALTLKAGKGVAAMLKIKKIAGLVMPALAKAALKIGKLAAALVLKAVKGIATIALTVISAKAVIAVGIVAGVVVGIYLFICSFLITIPALTDEQMAGYIDFVRRLDADVNEQILIDTEFAYEVIFINPSYQYDYQAVVHSRLITHLHNFFALYVVYFDNNWDNAEYNITHLHGLTHEITVAWEMHEIDYEMRDIALVHIRIFTLEEMKYILGLDDEQSEFLLYIIENRNLYEFFPTLGDRFFGEMLHGLTPEQVNYILGNVPIYWPVTPEFRRLTSPFGYRTLSGRLQFHSGIDLGMPIGTPIFATVGGTVTGSFYSTSGGEMIVITHETGIITRYLHLRICIQKLQFISKIVMISYNY